MRGGGNEDERRCVELSKIMCPSAVLYTCGAVPTLFGPGRDGRSLSAGRDPYVDGVCMCRLQEL